MKINGEKQQSKRIFFLLVVMTAVFLSGVLMTGCATTKVVREVRYQESRVDSMSIEAIVDGRIQSWHEKIDSSIFRVASDYSKEQEHHEDEKEKVTETITSYVDSLGREVREEQRVTERSLSRQWREREAQIQEEFRLQLQSAIARYDSIQQEKYRGMVSHWEKKDSSAVEKETETKKEDMSSKLVSLLWLIVLITAIVVIGWPMIRDRKNKQE